MNYQAINFRNKFALFDDHWKPKVIAEMNDYQFKIVKLQGDFIWHDHSQTDETFIVLEGDLTIHFRDGAVNVSAGEMFVVPKGENVMPWAVISGQGTSEAAFGCSRMNRCLPACEIWMEASAPFAFIVSASRDSPGR